MKYPKKNNVEKKKFIGGNEYLFSCLEVKLKEKDITNGQTIKKLKPCQISLMQQKRKMYQT